jgi:heat shock protein HslJ
MAMPSRPLITAVLSSLLMVAACGVGTGPSPAAGPTDTAPPTAQPDPTALPGPTEPPRQGLDGRTFLSTAIDGRGLVAGSRVQLSFEDGTVGASAGCNSMGGPYVVDGGVLRAPQLAMTEMGCEPARMAQDQWLAGLLDGAALTLDGDTLTLAKDGVTLTLVDREVADPDRPLVGTRWVVEGLVSGDAVSSLPAGLQAALVFSDGQVAVEAGCNSGGGAAQVADGTIQFGEIILTRLPCPHQAAAVEAAILAALAPRAGYTIEADVLTLDAGGVGLILRASS